MYILFNKHIRTIPVVYGRFDISSFSRDLNMDGTIENVFTAHDRGF